MIRYERQKNILDVLEQKSPSSVKEIAKTVFASESSVRRDIAAMEEKGLVKRIYGGVLLTERKNAIVPLELRDGEHASAKDAVAKRAAEEVFDGATVFLDASSTVRRMVKYLKKYKDLKIITNNLRICQDTEGLDGTVYCTGGAYDPKNRAFHGPAAERFAESVYADFFFFSSQGISLTGEISDASEPETALRRKMLQNAKKKFFLCDESKIGQKNLFLLCRKDEIDDIFCDCPLPWEK